MKILFIHFIILFTFLNTYKADAQITRLPYYDTCQYLQLLQGEWMNANGNDTIRIYLRYHRNFYSDPETYNSTIDELWGWVEYKQGNTVIMSDYANRFATLPYNLDDLIPGLRSIILTAGKGGHRVISAGYVGCVNPVVDLSGILIDRLRCNSDKTIMAIVNTQGTIMTCRLEQPTSLVDSLWCGGLTLPSEFILLKQ